MGSSHTRAVEKDLQLDLEFEKQIFDLRQLIEISKVLNSTLDYNLLLDSILFTCMGQMRVFNAGIFTRKRLRDEDFTLHRNFKGFDILRPKEYAIPADSRVLETLAQALHCFTLEELRELSDGDEGYGVLDSLGPDIIIPLTSRGHLHGIIVLGNRNPQRLPLRNDDDRYDDETKNPSFLRKHLGRIPQTLVYEGEKAFPYASRYRSFQTGE